jgi:F0F1-type ATP synthase epsilon subunit
MKNTDQPDTLTVIVRSPFNVYYDGPARSISAANRVGQFDVLPGHADFFSMLTPGEVSIQNEGEPVTVEASNGIITVRDNIAYVFLNM